MIPVKDRIFRFACDLAIAARIFTLEQIARHADLSWRTQPQKRASEFLRDYVDWFDKMPASVGMPARWRLSTKGKRRLGVKYQSINGVSQKAEHWIGLGDIWLTLTFAGGRPELWKTEWQQQFDVFCLWNGRPYLIEYQRTRISTSKWQAKWEQRISWYHAQHWTVKPKVVLVDVTGQEASTIGVPRGTIHVTAINAIPRTLGRNILK